MKNLKVSALNKTTKFAILSALAFPCAAFGTEAENASSGKYSVGEVVREILSGNPEINYYREEINTASAGVRFSSTWKDPELSFEVGGKNLKDSNGVKIGDGVVWQVSVSQTIEWPGRISLRKAIAERDLELAQLGLERFENALSARAKNLAFGLYAANAKAQAIAEVAQRYASLRETFLAREPGGISPMLETRVIEAAELSLKYRSTDAELDVQKALIDLNLLRGAKVDSPISVKTKEYSFKPSPDMEYLMSESEKFNFDYRMKLSELAKQGYAVELAENERYPDITLSPFVSMDNVGEKETVVGLGVSLPIPISGRTSSNAEVALSKRRQAETAAMLALRELRRSVAVASQRYSVKLAEYNSFGNLSSNKFKEAAELADRHFRMGSIPISAYVELQNSYLEAVDSILNLQSEILSAGLELEEMSGVNLSPTEGK